jgi:hypothetical protein
MAILLWLQYNDVIAAGTGTKTLHAQAVTCSEKAVVPEPFPVRAT